MIDENFRDHSSQDFISLAVIMLRVVHIRNQPTVESSSSQDLTNITKVKLSQISSLAFSLTLLLLSPDILEVLHSTNLGAPGLLHHDAGEPVVLHGPVIKVCFIAILPLIIATIKIFRLRYVNLV